MTRNTTSGRTWGIATGLALVLAGGLVASPAAADTAPADPTEPQTVAADSLPTAQINGVVWDQEIAGSTVFVGGDFTKARPAGAAAGSNEVDRTYLLSYNVTTGALTSWAPTLNGRVKEMALSPDGARLYVAGNFTSINGQNRYRLAAFDTATGQLVSTFRPTINAPVATVAASATAVVFGGTFTSVNSQSRSNVAAVDLSGANLPFAPTPAGGSVVASVFSPDGSQVVLGGAFTTMNGSSNPGYGLARFDFASGTMLPLPANSSIRNGGADAAVVSLAADNDYFYGSGQHFGGGGTMEGSFAASWATGELVWVEDCHGDTYDIAPVGDVVYSASHKHYCGNSGGFPQTDPWTYHRATASTKVAKGINTPDIYGYPDHDGEPRPDLLYWFPDINTGTFTGLSQGAWTVTGNSQYVIYGGEFTRVNGVNQQGLARFAVRSVAPNAEGPEVKGGNYQLSVKSFFAGQVRLSWQTNWDADNETLTYKVERQSAGNVIYTTDPVTTPFWKPLTLSYTDSSLAPGTSTRYRVRVEDPFGNSTVSNWADVTVSSANSLTPYAAAVLDDGAANYWRLSDPAGSTSTFDWSGVSDAKVGTGVTLGGAGAINGDSSTAASFNGTSNGLVATTNQIAGPQTFAIEAWFKTTSSAGGKIVGFGNNNTGTSTSYDRHVFMGTNGRVNFGVYPNAERTITSSRSYNDGQWHYVVATLGTDGMNLYVDGVRVAKRTDTTSAQSYSGYWRIGGDSTWSGGQWFNGQVDEVAIYSAPLTPQQVQNHWVASGRTSSLPQAPADAYGKAVFDLWPDLYWRLGESGNTTTAADSGPAGNPGTYRTGVTKSQTGVLSGVNNTAARFNGSGGLVASNTTFVSPTVYSEELWFKTTTTNGGKLIGFGSANSGTSTNYDRHVYMDTSGHLIFGVWTGQENTTTTPETYNDGAWHHVVATQSSEGLKLYVDGVLRGTNPQASAETNTGYWRIGGDNTWGGIQPWFAGTLDEVAIYPIALSAAQVQAHYTLGSGQAPQNQAPTAVISATVPPVGLTVHVDGTGSSDPENGALTYAWTFEDGSPATATTASADVTFPDSGTYTVGLTVTDDAGKTHHVEQDVTVTAPPPNQAPTAAIAATVPPVGLTVHVDGAGSSDPENGALTYAWTFEDGSPATATTASADVTFPGTGTYTVGLTVTDDHGLTNHTEQDVSVTAPPENEPPTAVISATVPATGLTVSVDGTGSSDPESGALTYAWTFESGTPATASTPTASVTFPGTGTYTVGLTVTDNAGKTASTSQEVTVTAPQPGDIPANALAWDAFGRTVSGGWGSAQVGGAWTATGTASQFGVNGSAATHAPSKNGTLLATLDGVSSSSTDIAVTISPDKVLDGSGAWVSVIGRKVGSDAYTARVRLQPDGTVQLHLTRQGGTAVSGGTVAGLTYGAGDQLRVRFQVESMSPTSTALRVKIWKVGTSEPADWWRTYTDTVATSLQAPGSVGLQTYLFNTVTNAPVIRFDDLVAVPVGADVPPPPPPAENQPPVAAFAANVPPVGLTVPVDASGSSDPEGTALSYAWTFESGTPATATTSTASVTFPGTGTYTIGLTVTDAGGKTASTSQQVSVTAPDPGDIPANALAWDAFDRTVSGGWGSAQVGGAWTATGTASQFAVNGAVASHSPSRNGTLTSQLTGVSSSSTDVSVTISPDKLLNGTGAWVTLQGRTIGADAYSARVRLQPDGTVQLHLMRSGTALRGSTVAGLTYGADTQLRLRLQVESTSPTSTTLRAKIWVVGTTEPVAWTYTQVDSTAGFQAPGGVGISTYLFSGVTNTPAIRFDDFVAVPVA